MMAGRHKQANCDWDIGNNRSYEAVQLVVLMDIRHELQRLNSLLHCHNFQQIPRTLTAIRRKLPTPKKRKVRK